jgi:hypothetical protein
MIEDARAAAVEQLFKERSFYPPVPPAARHRLDSLAQGEGMPGLTRRREEPPTG